MKTKEEIRKELIKILEDTPMYMTRDIEEAIKTKKILEIAIKNPKKIADKILKLFSQQKREMVEEIDKYICENKGIYPFPTIEEKVAREIQDLIITSNKT